METQRHYQFINSMTGNIIAYFSLPEDTDESITHAALEKKRIEAAINNQLPLDVIYWQDETHSIF